VDLCLVEASDSPNRNIEVPFELVHAVHPVDCQVDWNQGSLAEGTRLMPFWQDVHPPSTRITSVSARPKESVNRSVVTFRSESDVVIEESWHPCDISSVPGMCVAPSNPKRKHELACHCTIVISLRQLLEAIVLD
jgi:hypothetical protein